MGTLSLDLESRINGGSKAMTASSYRTVSRYRIVIAGMLGLFGALGLGRFSLGMMLPAMGEGLGLTYGQMGAISTANFCGYLMAVLACGALAGRLGARPVIFLGLALIGLSMILIGVTDTFASALVLYTLTGVGSALANIPIMGLIAVWFPPAVRGRAAGLCVAGNGLGIMFSGKAVPLLNTMTGGYRSSWLVFGGIVMVISLICLALVQNTPAGDDAATRDGGGQESRQTLTTEKRGVFHLSGALYFLFGFTYVIYVTFLVTSLVEERGFSEQEAGALWAWVGLLAISSGPLFGWVSDTIGRKRGLMVVFSLQSLAYFLAAWAGPAPAIYLSALCFALVAFSVPTIMAALVGDLAGPGRAAAMFGYVTFVFGFGQIAGPAVAGTIAEWSGSFAGSFLLAGLLTALAVLLCTFLPGKSQ